MISWYYLITDFTEISHFAYSLIGSSHADKNLILSGEVSLLCYVLNNFLTFNPVFLLFYFDYFDVDLYLLINALF